MACHMPPRINNTGVGRRKGAEDTEGCTQGRKQSEAGRNWFRCFAVAAGGAEASYDWLGETAAWATMAATAEAAIQSEPPFEQLPPIETLAIETLQLSCASTPTPSAPSSARLACSSIKTPWVRTGSRSVRCTARETPPGACAPRSPRTAALGHLVSSSSSTELLTRSPSLVLVPRPRGLVQLAQSTGQPREPTYAPPPLRPPSAPAPESPTVLALELEQNVSVTNTKLENGVGLYEITWSDKADSVHTVWRRYSDFSDLHMSLCDDRSVGEVVESIAFPPKRPLSSFSRAQRERLLAERRHSLENYLARLVLEGIVVPDKSDAAGERLAAFLTDGAEV